MKINLLLIDKIIKNPFSMSFRIQPFMRYLLEVNKVPVENNILLIGTKFKNDGAKPW